METIALLQPSVRLGPPFYVLPAWFEARGHLIVMVNPSLPEVRGEQACANHRAVLRPIEMLLCFRRTEDVAPIVEAASAVGSSRISLQAGLAVQEVTARAEATGSTA